MLTVKPLIDGDILLHELGWSGEFKDKETGEFVTLPFEHVQELLDAKIRLICDEVDATAQPTIYLTNSEWLTNYWNKTCKWYGLPEITYQPVFRYEVAKTKPYKGHRKNPKPFHFYNILVHLLSNYDCVISTDGYEADDMMCMDQDETTIICSRDKDLRICPGWHYSWECGGQRSVGPVETDELGWLEKVEKWDEEKEKYIFKDVRGYGLKFFYYQMLVGDSADHIPGLPGWGKAGAFKLLADLPNKEEVIAAVKAEYKNSEKINNAKEYFLEQANLLWMIQKKGEGFVLQ